ncbi:holin [Arthrobacter phage BarretLemon]|uniref:Holin n=1 Tax=Arthrobacter phage BarretLemon TaxID=1796994 RepID=A0A140G754_9CAUD|nr:holin [Arthrobacter phage BarretLemon]AMM44489.1 holin [Arthrobacter phage BarretLemon]
MKLAAGIAGIAAAMLAIIVVGSIYGLTSTVVLLVILWASFVSLTVYYAIVSRWRQYLAGRVFMYLLWAFDALATFLLFSRLVDSRDVRLNVYNVLIAGLIGTVWLIIGAISKSQKHARVERLRRAQHQKEEELSNDD